ncbi:MAG TPA: glutathione peroxidase [Blastocatellia bacterium]|nr:glutathione peroxidase [Blastocatellia bacterium]
MKIRSIRVVSMMAIFGAVVSIGLASRAEPVNEKITSVYDFTLKDIDRKEVNLGQYRGKVLLLVNVASRCGFTPQYEGLQRIYLKYKDRGFVILGFPANNFLGQEPGTEEEIKTFCSTKYNVTFPMFSKISVKGDDIHPLYKFLTSKDTNPDFGGDIKWNFNKFLVDKNGKIVARFEPAVKPESEQVVQAVEKVLQ